MVAAFCLFSRRVIAIWTIIAFQCIDLVFATRQQIFTSLLKQRYAMAILWSLKTIPQAAVLQMQQRHRFVDGKDHAAFRNIRQPNKLWNPKNFRDFDLKAQFRANISRYEPDRNFESYISDTPLVCREDFLKMSAPHNSFSNVVYTSPPLVRHKS